MSGFYSFIGPEDRNLDSPKGPRPRHHWEPPEDPPAVRPRAGDYYALAALIVVILEGLFIWGWYGG